MVNTRRSLRWVRRMRGRRWRSCEGWRLNEAIDRAEGLVSGMVRKRTLERHRNENNRRTPFGIRRFLSLPCLAFAASGLPLPYRAKSFQIPKSLSQFKHMSRCYAMRHCCFVLPLSELFARVSVHAVEGAGQKSDAVQCPRIALDEVDAML
jgi:hypothetical protein